MSDTSERLKNNITSAATSFSQRPTATKTKDAVHTTTTTTSSSITTTTTTAAATSIPATISFKETEFEKIPIPVIENGESIFKTKLSSSDNDNNNNSIIKKSMRNLIMDNEIRKKKELEKLSNTTNNDDHFYNYYYNDNDDNDEDGLFFQIGLFLCIVFIIVFYSAVVYVSSRHSAWIRYTFITLFLLTLIYPNVTDYIQFQGRIIEGYSYNYVKKFGITIRDTLFFMNN